MNKDEVKKYQKQVSAEIVKTSRFMNELNRQDPSQTALQAFDSMLSAKGGGEKGMQQMPTPLAEILKVADFNTGNAEVDQYSQSMIFDGLRDGVEEYKKLNGGQEPPTSVVYSALLSGLATAKAGTGEKDTQLDSLTFGHHESLSVVPTSVQVVISHSIANSIPLIAMLPNPTGSNEVPLVHGEELVGSNIGARRKGELIDGAKAGLPYIDNIHTLVMTDGGSGSFTLDVHHGYTKEIRANKSTKFVVDTSLPKAPFVGGRVEILVKGVVVGHDKNINHPVDSGTSTITSVGEVTLGTETYLLKTGTANLDDHSISVEFDAKNTVPTGDEVEARIVYDYERKDGKDRILEVPSLDVKFQPYSIYAHSVYALSSATIDSITQLQNELGISWYATIQVLYINSFNVEQTSRLLREAVSVCLNNEDHKVTFDADKAGIEFNSMSEMFANIKVTFGKGRRKLSTATNTPIGAYDIYTSDRGAEFFAGMGSDFESVNAPFGHGGNIYLIGRMRNGTNVYYVPADMGVFNDHELNNGSHMMIVPRVHTPAKSPFVGTVSVPFMPRKSNRDAFEDDGGVYARVGAEVNPIPRYGRQFMLVELLNIPTL